MRKKRSFTLIEVLISLSLLSMALGAFFFWYRELSLEKSKNKKIVAEMAQERHCNIRLSKIVPKIMGKETIFYADGTSFVFIFDHGIHSSPLLSDGILGRIYFDKENELLLFAMWPHPKSLKKEPNVTNILLKDVKDCSFEFYYPPQDRKKIVDPKEIGSNKPLTGWQSVWKREYEALPAMVKITVKRKETIEFVYTLENVKQTIQFYRDL